jgi:hypothetical protein
VNRSVELIFIRLPHPTVDFPEFPCAIVYGSLVERNFSLLTLLERHDDPSERLVVDVNGFDPTLTPTSTFEPVG